MIVLRCKKGLSYVSNLDWKCLVECPMAKYTTYTNQDWFECYDKTQRTAVNGGIYDFFVNIKVTHYST